MNSAVVLLTRDVTGHTVPEQTYCFFLVHMLFLCYLVFRCSDMNSSYSTFYYHKLFLRFQ